MGSVSLTKCNETDAASKLKLHFRTRMHFLIDLIHNLLLLGSTNLSSKMWLNLTHHEGAESFFTIDYFFTAYLCRQIYENCTQVLAQCGFGQKWYICRNDKIRSQRDTFTELENK